ncbi:D-isomer specific 2-hydroxyacid dehydrogenase NAD-binding protein [Macrophomina phaseolina MS6]|uniref:D-isomer specific 2-hydroxyacid dehydrogenase NAD-binding protein n=1 Tax=Macrophomina phaseolina (strain MS6) TaxID=1126212 RepID=K2R5F7_MACPH|nr:D-isomer specific 2-hydroxyacid dehydrogenase NAD-binding protein [Macrophomina phaseolina MS6]
MALRAGQWRGNPPPPLGHDPEGKVLGILGMGGIGRNLKRKVEVFGMKVIYHNRRKLSEEQSGGAEYVSFDDLLARSDVLSLNLPLNTHRIPVAPPPPFFFSFPSLVVPFSFRPVARSLASYPPRSLACRFRLSHQTDPRPGRTRRARVLGEPCPKFFPSFHEAFHFSPPFPFALPPSFQNTSITQSSSFCTGSRFPLIPEMCNLPSSLTHNTSLPHTTHKLHSHRRRLHCLSDPSIPFTSPPTGEESAVHSSPNIPFAPVPQSKYIPRNPGNTEY